MSRHRWRFASGQAQLSRRVEEPESKWDAAYNLPADLLLLHDVTVNDNVIEYDRYQNLVYCDAVADDVVVADYTFRADEDLWPPYFVTLIELQLASIFAYSVANQINTADFMEKKALRQMALARHIDSTAQTTRRFDLSRFDKARRTIR
jgi:hypothetical protein